MPWLRIDDAFLEHPKVIGLTDRQLRLHLTAMLYAARHRTGGHVPEAALKALRVTAKERQLFFHNRLWDLPAEMPDGIEVHDFAIYNGATLDDRIAAYLDSNPEATANDVHRAVGGRKAVVLTVIQRLRPGSEVVPQAVPGNQEGTTDDRFPSGSQTVPRARDADARGPQPLPLEVQTAAAGTTEPEPDAAAALIEKLDDLGLNGTALELALAEPDRAQAWIDLAATEARTNPGGFVLTGLKSRAWPAVRKTTTSKTTSNLKITRARQRIEDDWHTLDRIGLDNELREMGIPAYDREPLYAWAAEVRGRFSDVSEKNEEGESDG